MKRKTFGENKEGAKTIARFFGVILFSLKYIATVPRTFSKKAMKLLFAAGARARYFFSAWSFSICEAIGSDAREAMSS